MARRCAIADRFSAIKLMKLCEMREKNHDRQSDHAGHRLQRPHERKIGMIIRRTVDKQSQGMSQVVLIVTWWFLFIPIIRNKYFV